MNDSAQATTSPLYSTLGDDPDFGEIVEMFVEEMPERIAALTELITQQDREPLRRMAHQLKGAGGGYGFPDISAQAACLEYAVRDAQPEAEIRLALNDLIDLCSRARAGSPQ